MRAFLVLVAVALTLSCKKKEPEAGPPPLPGVEVPRAGSAAFHLEIGAVHARYQDYKGAIEHLSKAVELAQDPAQRAQALVALGAAKRSARDLDGAVEALERASDELDKLAAAQPGGAAPAGMIGIPGDDLHLQLARLHAERGRDDEALKACRRGLSRPQQPWDREQLERVEVDLLRKTGALEKRIEESAGALEAKTPDEPALRFLVAALAGDPMPAPAVPGESPSGPPPAVSPMLVRAYERLRELHPDDPQLRQTLQSLLERAGRVDDAVKLRSAAAAATPMECAGAFAPAVVPGALEGPVEAVRIRMRAGQAERARAETEKLAAEAKRSGVAAYVVAADLLLEQGAADRASQLVAQAGREARSPDDRRQVALAHERAAARAGRAEELKALYDAWKRSDDPCLRLAATERAQQLAMAPAMPPPPPPPLGP